MSKDKKEFTRRKFLELTAAGATGAAVYSLAGPSAFAASPKKGGTLKVGVSWMWQYPDPHRWTGGTARPLIAMGYEGLTMPVSVGERQRIIAQKGASAVPDVVPMLAESWDIEKGGKRVVFHLKKGVKFHNGKEFGSDDVEWNWKRILDPVHRASARKLVDIFLKDFETPDKYTFIANLTQPYGAFLQMVSMPNVAILAKDSIPKGAIWGKTATFKPTREAPPGTGPFELVKYRQKLEARWVGFKDYHGGAPHLDGVNIKVIPDGNARTLAVRSGDIDVSLGVEQNFLKKHYRGHKPYELIHLKKEGLNLYPNINPWTKSLYLNSHPTKPHGIPFRDERVRQAFDYCIDQKTIAKACFGELGIPMDQGFHPDLFVWGFDDIKGREYNPGKAKKLLEAAGYAGGCDVEIRIPGAVEGADKMAQVIQQMSRPAGFRITISSSRGGAYWGVLRKYAFQTHTWALWKEDPMHSYYLNMHTSPDKPYSGQAPVTGINDPVMDKLLDQVAAENDLGKRKAIFKKVVQRNIDKAYVLPYMTYVTADAWTDKLKNFSPGDQFHHMAPRGFKDAWLDT